MSVPFPHVRRGVALMPPWLQSSWFRTSSPIARGNWDADIYEGNCHKPVALLWLIGGISK